MVTIDMMADQFKLLGDKTRLNIISILLRQEACVCHLVEILKTTQPNISQHLRKLKDGGIVREERRGQWIYYSLAIEDKPYIQEALAHLPALGEEAVAILGGLPCKD
ncbi:metalloregulator ArsR/SmtB family transcription factor [Paenibacillus thiaminolyticus]|uniref:Metalloregulator ArsR/SmtB family transcription factor n=1 Tax=Paenibacillus thiaminolyticus TaxID=49283 RepID=A0AAP9DWG1_PANTH|nr:metalloregulator ArsR/SmtB family transcription factor [Paenibacillus thiaminolyticus]MCY9538979.1 metalloregulator ArsR/SmtB family transcription factor [Paenibacillus thiaminolyticus]MCY9604235.1 metalloregulator ArsR/SmtB family transcription factor [Paenibacillus thiaminolyticus]MCY9608090.1 metalloregulator ArsR/SmtB family transcription factor [Paenibacillus thiaminolyticus]MCY9612929.1 metalloregulator ArsR/SmtB family transcription factor [Paenibacillus thiaminolyticus]MCY9622017.1 